MSVSLYLFKAQTTPTEFSISVVLCVTPQVRVLEEPLVTELVEKSLHLLNP